MSVLNLMCYNNHKHMCTVLFRNITTIPADRQVSSLSRGGQTLLRTMFMSCAVVLSETAQQTSLSVKGWQRWTKILFKDQLKEICKKLTTKTCLVTVSLVICTSDTYCAWHSWKRYQSIAMVTEVVAGASDRVFTWICIFIFIPFVPTNTNS